MEEPVQVESKVKPDELKRVYREIQDFKWETRNFASRRRRRNLKCKAGVLQIGYAIVEFGISVEGLDVLGVMAALLAVNVVCEEEGISQYKRDPALLRKYELLHSLCEMEGVKIKCVGGFVVFRAGIFCSRIPLWLARKIQLKYHRKRR